MLCSTKRHFDFLPHCEGYFDFFNKNSLFWLIPCDTLEGLVYGFVLRSYRGKSYMLFSEGEIAPVYGFHDFGGYRRGYPIVLCEGIKDREVLAQSYRYCLAVLTSRVPNTFLPVLRALSSKAVIAFDADETGERMSSKACKRLSSEYISTKVIRPKLHDFGSYISNRNYIRLMNAELLQVLEEFGFSL